MKKNRIDPMGELLRKHAQFIVRHAWAVLAVSLVATAIIASGMTRLKISVDADQQLPANHPYIVVDRQIRKEFGGTNFIAIALVPQSGTIWRRDLLQVVHDITDELLVAPGIIRQNVVSLSSPYVRIPKDQDGVLTIDYLMKEVPPDEAGIAAVRDLYRQEPLFKGTVVSDDERAALVLVDFYDSDRNVATIVKDIVAKYRSDTLDIALTGGPIFDDTTAALVGGQASFSAATGVVMVLILWLVFGHIQGVILPSATALLATATALGLMGFAGIPMNAWTAAVPLMVMTVAAGHSAQMLKRYYEEFRQSGDADRAVVESTQRIGAVMIAAGSTAGCGFAALALLGIPVLGQFGLGVASGIFAAVILEMTFMLALRVLWRTRSAEEGPLSGWLGALLRPLARVVSARPGVVVTCFVALALFAVAGYPRLTTEVTMETFWSEHTPAGRDLRVFWHHFPSTTTLTILLTGESGQMQTPEAIALMTGLQQALKEDPDVGRTSSVADIIRRTHEVFAPEAAAGGLPLEKDLIAQLFYLAASPAFERFVNREYSHAVVLAFLNKRDTEVTRRVIRRLEQYLTRNPPGNIQVGLAGGAGPTLLALNDDTVDGKVINIAVVLGVIFMLASLLLRNPLGGAYVTAPLLMALVVNLGLFAWLGVAFDLSGASIAAICVGIGADYAIYFLYRLREEYRRIGDIDRAFAATLDTSGRAVLFVALAISAGFAVFAVSDFYTFRILGIFLPLTMLVSCLTALTLLPALVLIFRPRFILAPGGKASIEESRDEGSETKKTVLDPLVP